MSEWSSLSKGKNHGKTITFHSKGFCLTFMNELRPHPYGCMPLWGIYTRVTCYPLEAIGSSQTDRQTDIFCILY